MTAGLGWTTSAQMDKPTWDWFLLLGLLILAACYGNVGCVGLVLDDAHAAAGRAHKAQLAEALKREAAENQAVALQQLLDQRDRLASERVRLLHLLAHGIRQPLHNASGALQAADAVLLQQHADKASQTDQIGLATTRLHRAQGVLGDVQAALDNTLAAVNLLARQAPLLLAETELDFLVHLALGDLPEAQRSAVQLHTMTDLRSAELEPGLLRLALRNPLRSAFAHGGAGMQMQLHITEQDSPAALVISVLDNGVGLGLHLAGQVAALHGGHLRLDPHPPHGLQASLVLPLLGAAAAQPSRSGTSRGSCRSWHRPPAKSLQAYPRTPVCRRWSAHRPTAARCWWPPRRSCRSWGPSRAGRQSGRHSGS